VTATDAVSTSIDRTLIASYLDHQRMRSMSPRTIDRRANTLRLFVDAEQAGLSGATLDTVEHFLASRTAASTKRAYLSDLKSFYAWALKRSHLDHDPTRDVDVPKVPKRMPTPLSDDDVRRVLAAVDPGSDLERIVYLCLFAGLRTSEVAALRTEDIDHDSGVIVIRRGKGGGDAVLPMAPQLSAVLLGLPPGCVVDVTDRVGVSYRINRLFRRLGIIARPHDLRHTYGTNLAKVTNGNVLAVRDLMRHSSVATTQRYIGWSPDSAGIVASLYEREPPAPPS